ncbi:cation:proton antiporter, partial [Streptomyces sp. NPDC059949]
AGIEPAIGPLATAYVLILVVIGPLTARYTEPAAAWISRRRNPSGPLLTGLPTQPGSREDIPAPAQDPAGRA